MSFYFLATGRSVSTAVSKKPKKAIPWTHNFVCLADAECDHVPNNYLLLAANGLEPAKISLFEESTEMDINFAILDKFPKLKETAYNLMRTVANSKSIEVIVAPPSGYTGAFLKTVLGQAKCFIQLIRDSISLDEATAKSANNMGMQSLIPLPQKIPETVPRAKCEFCRDNVPMFLFQEHNDTCSYKGR